MAEKLGFEQAGGNGGAIDFDEGAFAARTEIVNGAGDEFFAGAGFAEDEDGGGCRRDKLDLGESALERGAVSDDLLKIEFAANFFFEIKLFYGELVFEGVNFLEG